MWENITKDVGHIDRAIQKTERGKPNRNELLHIYRTILKTARVGMERNEFRHMHRHVGK